MKTFRKILLATFLAALTAGLVWAGAELMGQANKSAAYAGSNAADLEMASLDMIKPSTNAPNVDWAQEKKLRQQMEANTAQYTKLINGLNGEKASQATYDQGMKLAYAFRDLSEKYAAVWDAAGNCQTRARLAREVGLSRVSSAEMALTGTDGDKIDASTRQLKSLQEARSDYVADAKKDLNPADRKALQDNLLPKAQNLLTSVTTLSTQVTSLVNDVMSQASSVASGNITAAIGGCTRQMASGATSDNPATALLSPVKALASMVSSMLTSVKGLISDIMSLA